MDRRAVRAFRSGGPAGHGVDAEHDHACERAIPILHVALGQSFGESVGQIRHRRLGRFAEPTQPGAHPPERRPVVSVPMLDEQGRAGVGFEVALALEPGRRLRFDEIDRDADVEVDCGVHHRYEVGATGGVQCREDTVIVSGETLVRLLWRKVHLMTTRKLDDDRRRRVHRATGLIVGMAPDRRARTASDVGS